MKIMKTIAILSSNGFADLDLFTNTCTKYLPGDYTIRLGVGSVKTMAEQYAINKGWQVVTEPRMFDLLKGVQGAIIFTDGRPKGGMIMAEQICNDRNIGFKLVPFNPHIVIDKQVVELPKPEKKKRKPRPPGDNKWKIRYQQAHEANFAEEHPHSYKDGHYIDPVYPKVRESNGLQTAIVNILNWYSHRAKRINNMGRQVNGKWIKSAAGKGQADISATLWGRSTQLEVKTGADKPSPSQLKEQAKERKAGGIYEFVYSIEQFFEVYDGMKVSLSQQSQMF